MEFRWKLIDQRFLFIFIVSRYWMIGRDDVTFFLNNFLNRFFLFCNPFSRFISSRIIFINYGQGRSIARERELDKILYTMRVLRAGKKGKNYAKLMRTEETHWKLSIFITDIIIISSSLDEEKARS